MEFSATLKAVGYARRHLTDSPAAAPAVEEPDPRHYCYYLA